MWSCVGDDGGPARGVWRRRTGRSSAARPPASAPTIPTCPTPGARPRTSPGSRRFPGIGWSSPVVWGDHVFRDDRRQQRRSRSRPSRASTSATGRHPPRRTAGWSTTSTSAPARCAGSRKSASTPPAKAKHLKNSYASETPVTDGERVYFYFANARPVRASTSPASRSGRSRSARSRRATTGAPPRRPALHGDRVYIVNDNDEQSFLAAYDTRTGAGDVARRPEGRDELVDAVRLGERAAHRDRHVGLRPRALLRPVRQAAVGAHRDVDDLAFRRRSRATACSTSAPATSPIRCARRTRSGPARPATSR